MSFKNVAGNKKRMLLYVNLYADFIIIIPYAPFLYFQNLIMQKNFNTVIMDLTVFIYVCAYFYILVFSKFLYVFVSLVA